MVTNKKIRVKTRGVNSVNFFSVSTLNWFQIGYRFVIVSVLTCAAEHELCKQVCLPNHIKYLIKCYCVCVFLMQSDFCFNWWIQLSLFWFIFLQLNNWWKIGCTNSYFLITHLIREVCWLCYYCIYTPFKSERVLWITSIKTEGKIVGENKFISSCICFFKDLVPCIFTF